MDDLNVQDTEHLERFVKEHNAHLAGMIIAFQYRRGRARNAAAMFGTGSQVEPPLLSGPDADLLVYHEDLTRQEELDDIAGGIYETLQEKRLRAESIIDIMQTAEMPVAERAEYLTELQALEEDIKEQARLLEELTRV